MSFQWVRMNLGVAIFPFATELWGRSIIVPQFDQNFDRVSEQNVPNKDRGIPQAFYMHNVVPTGQGYQSIGYDNRLVGIPAATDFDTCLSLSYTAPNNAKVLFSPSSGKNYIYDGSVGAWASISPITGTVGATTLVTVAEVSGTTYIYYEGIGCFTYDTATKTMVAVPLTGLVAASIKGIVAANGYLIAFSDTDVAWSSTSNPTDFVPSLITGAGGGSVQFTNGIINFCLPISGGFMLYCEKNTVSATYTGNVRFPYIFADVIASGGCDSPEKVSWQSNLSVHYAYTTSGVQELSKASASGASYPEITDFLSQQLFEDFDEVTLALTVEYLSSQLNVKVTAVGDRFIVFSYGKDVDAPDYSHAIVLDAALKRWGKLKITHRKCFEWQTPNAYGDISYDDLAAFSYDDLAFTTYDDLAFGINVPERPKKDLAFMQGDGKVVTVNFDFGGATANGVLMLGKFQFQRNKWIEHQFSDIENVRLGNSFRFLLFPTVDGKTFLAPYEMIARNLIINAPMMKRYAHWLPAQNLTACFIGSFNLTSYLMQFTLGGDS